MKKVALQVLFFFATAASALGNGNVVGNGGNVGQCEAGGRWKLLDLIEAGRDRGFHYTQLERYRGQNWERAFTAIVARYLRPAPATQRRLLELFRHRRAQMNFVKNGLPLYSSGSLDGTCRVQQAAIQYTGSVLSGSAVDLQISAPVWSVLDSDQRAALLLHEYLISTRLFEDGGCVTGEVRGLVAFVLSDEALAMAPGDWQIVFGRQCSDFPSL